MSEDNKQLLKLFKILKLLNCVEEEPVAIHSRLDIALPHHNQVILKEIKKLVNDLIGDANTTDLAKNDWVDL